MTENRRERWIRSRYCSGANSTCVEVSMEIDGVGVRDGKENAGPVLFFNSEEWRTFVRGVRAGDFSV